MGIKKQFLFLLIALFGLGLTQFCLATQATKAVDLYFFYDETCPICTQTAVFLGQLAQKYPGLKIKSFEISKGTHLKIYLALGKIYHLDLSSTPVPGVFIGEKAFNKYNDLMMIQVEQTVVKCLAQGCASPLEKLKAEEKNAANEKTLKLIPWPVVIVLAFILFFLFRKPKK